MKINFYITEMENFYIIKKSFYGCRNDVAILDKFDVNGVSILSFKRYAFSNKVLTLMLVYRKQSI